MPNLKKKKKLTCYIGDKTDEDCGQAWFKSCQLEKSFVAFKDCTADISKYLMSLGVTDDDASENWLILNRLKLENIPENAKICPKHRLNYTTGWKPLLSCQYPGHKDAKGVKRVKKTYLRTISSGVNSEIQVLFSSAAKKNNVPVGSKWCNNCRLRVHSELRKDNEHILSQNVNSEEIIPGTPERSHNSTLILCNLSSDAELSEDVGLSDEENFTIEPGKYFRIKVTDEQINHFLDFLQYGGLVQDVASGTRSVKLSSNRNVTMPNVVRTVHKAEVIRLYEGACDRNGYIKDTGRPSTRTLWNILNNCPASQRKSLAGLDNVAAEGSDAFDVMNSVMQFVSSRCIDVKAETDEIMHQLKNGKRYLKGEYKANCADVSGSEVADHCRPFALSDPKELLFQNVCNHEHDKVCEDCENLKKAMSNVVNIVKTVPNLTEKERSNFLYDITEAKKCIETWKGHILTVMHQEKQKSDILEALDDKTAFIIVDFAMKFLSRRYRESMAKWFGKAGHGMHVLCCIFKQEEKLVKRTYIVFIGKASQDVGAVMAIYETCLRQIQVDAPQIKFIIDKSDNAGCYHNEILFAWKAQWPLKNVGITFLEIMFNERQAGKDQCDRDSATAKRQINFYVEQGKNIENSKEMTMP